MNSLIIVAVILAVTAFWFLVLYFMKFVIKVSIMKSVEDSLVPNMEMMKAPLSENTSNSMDLGAGESLTYKKKFISMIALNTSISGFISESVHEDLQEHRPEIIKCYNENISQSLQALW